MNTELIYIRIVSKVIVPLVRFLIKNPKDVRRIKKGEMNIQQETVENIRYCRTCGRELSKYQKVSLYDEVTGKPLEYTVALECAYAGKPGKKHTSYRWKEAAK